MPPPVLQLCPEQFIALIAERLVARRTDASFTDCEITHAVRRRYERGEMKKVGLDVLYGLARHYRCSLHGLIDLSSEDPLADEVGTWPTHAPDWATVDSHVRRRLRQLRKEHDDIGTKALAAAANERLIRDPEQPPAVEFAWIFRIESGEYRCLDVVRLWAITDVLGLPTSALLPPPLKPRPHP